MKGFESWLITRNKVVFSNISIELVLKWCYNWNDRDGTMVFKFEGSPCRTSYLRWLIVTLTGALRLVEMLFRPGWAGGFAHLSPPLVGGLPTKAVIEHLLPLWWNPKRNGFGVPNTCKRFQTRLWWAVASILAWQAKAQACPEPAHHHHHRPRRRRYCHYHCLCLFAISTAKNRFT